MRAVVAKMASEEGRSLLAEEKVDEIMGSPQGEGDSDVELSGCGASACCDPRRAWHRFMALLFMCFLGFGSYFCYDNPGALQDHFIDDMNINTAEYANLYSWYSWPNVFLCFIGGFLIDRVFGIRLGTVIFSGFVMVGQLIFAMGGLVDKFWVMEAGRFVFGIGGESLAVAQNTYAVSWFRGKELNMVFGLQLSFSRVGSTVNFLVMESVYEWVNETYKGATCMGVVLMLASVTCLLSLICALVLGFLDRRAEKIMRKEKSQNDVVRLWDVKDFPLSFWLISLICVAYYVAIFPFVGLGKVFFERKFDFAPKSANTVNSIIYIISAVASPLLGFMVDRTGRNVFWLLLAVVVTLGGHALLAFTFINPYVAVVIMGLAYSMLASALWPLVALVIPEHQLGTAYGIMQSVQNLGLAIITMIAGMIVDSKGYLVLEVFFLAWLCVCLVSSIILWLSDESRGRILNQSARERLASKQKELQSSKEILVDTING